MTTDADRDIETLVESFLNALERLEGEGISMHAYVRGAHNLGNAVANNPDAIPFVQSQIHPDIVSVAAGFGESAREIFLSHIDDYAALTLIHKLGAAFDAAAKNRPVTQRYAVAVRDITGGDIFAEPEI